MRRFAILAATIWLCGCGSKETPPKQSQAKPPEASASNALAASAPRPAVSYIDGAADSFRQLDSDVKASLLRAEQLIAQGKLGGAIEILEHVIGEHPKTALAFVLRGQANAILKNDLRALADFSAAVALEEGNARHYTARGFFQLSQGNTRRAIDDFNKAIEIDPKDPVPFNNRGMARVQIGEINLAIEDFDNAIELNPKYVTAYNNRSFAHLRCDRRKEALTDLDKALELDPKAAGTYNNRGVLQLDDHNYPMAIADFTRAIKLEATNASYYINRRETYLKLERYNEARADAAKIERLAQLVALNEAVMRDRRSPKPYVDRGNYFLDDGYVEAAFANFDRAIELDRTYWPALMQRARALVRRGELEKAVADCTAALAVEERDEIYAVRAEAYRKLKDYAKAVADYDASHRFDSDVAEAWVSYAKELRRGGRGKEADDAQKRAEEYRALNGPSAN